jgi:hypothetical protein
MNLSDALLQMPFMRQQAVEVSPEPLPEAVTKPAATEASGKGRHMENDYRAKRNPYVPKYGNRKAIFIFESPPKEGAYFYDTTNTPGKDQLFNAMMLQILGLPKQTKVAGLRAFADAGYLLIDATYTPVNDDNLCKSEREARGRHFRRPDFISNC